MIFVFILLFLVFYYFLPFTANKDNDVHCTFHTMIMMNHSLFVSRGHVVSERSVQCILETVYPGNQVHWN